MRELLFGYAVIGYLAAMATLTFLILWVYPWAFMPLTVDQAYIKLDADPWLVDTLLLLLFGIQHSLMARPFVQERLFAGRSETFKAATYTLASALALLILYLFWQPITTMLWEFQDGIGYWLPTLLYILGWLFAFVATFMIDHFALFGLHQGYRRLRNIPEPEPHFQTRGFYRYMRHPIQAGTLLGLWATPLMSAGHLLLSIGMTLYVLIGLYLEEKNLVRTFGDTYRRYQREVPMLLPEGGGSVF